MGQMLVDATFSGSTVFATSPLASVPKNFLKEIPGCSYLTKVWWISVNDNLMFTLYLFPSLPTGIENWNGKVYNILFSTSIAFHYYILWPPWPPYPPHTTCTAYNTYHCTMVWLNNSGRAWCCSLWQRKMRTGGQQAQTHQLCHHNPPHRPLSPSL